VYIYHIYMHGMLRRMDRPKREEVTGGWRKLHNVEFHRWYSSANMII